MQFKDRFSVRSSKPERTDWPAVPRIDLEQLHNGAWPPQSPTAKRDDSEDHRLLVDAEREAKRINDVIDSQIEQERQERKRKRADIRILLLGASYLS